MRTSPDKKRASRRATTPCATSTTLEQTFFKTLNRVVEPMVRAGVGSPRIVPTGLILLETRGRKSGRLLRNPLAATRIGQHVVVATFRGESSQWVRNLASKPRTRYWLAGKPRETRAYVMFPGKRIRIPKSLPGHMQQVVRVLSPYTKVGWAFAILAPVLPAVPAASK